MSSTETRPLISVVTPCYNEEENVGPMHAKIKEIFATLPAYRYEHIFIDNSSTDRTVAEVKKIAAGDRAVKLIVNARNFGHIRSPVYGLLQASGDAVVLMAADFQDPPEMVVDFIRKWEEGFKVVVGIKSSSDENFLMFRIRNFYYNFLSKISELKITKNYTGYGLYDRAVLEVVKEIDDPYPYFRGLLNYIGFDVAQIEFHQPVRKFGFTKNNFYSLYDMAMLGIVNHSKVPVRLAAMAGFFMSGMSLLLAGGVFVAKLLFWNHFTVGIAPILIALFFFSSVLLFFIGMLGEYIAAIHTQVQKRPLVIEKERINFDVAATHRVGRIHTVRAAQ